MKINPYTKKVKKREKIVIHNVDGTTEELKTGIVFTLKNIEIGNDGLGIEIIGKHCNTSKFKDEYIQGLAHIIVHMLENEEETEKMFEE